MLKVDDVTCRYGRIEVLHGVSLEVGAGEIVTLIGSNGAGKTTLMRVISGILPMAARPHHCSTARTSTGCRRMSRVVRGIAQVPEARQVFAPLSVEDNLLLGAYRRRAADVPREIDRVYALFPVLAERRGSAAGTLSGGQQQMLAIGRALMSGPRLLLLDEPSMGLAPVLVDQILDTVVALAQGRRDHPAGRAECECGARHRRPRLCARDRPHRARRARARRSPTIRACAKPIWGCRGAMADEFISARGLTVSQGGSGERARRAAARARRQSRGVAAHDRDRRQALAGALDRARSSRPWPLADARAITATPCTPPTSPI